MNSPYSFIFSLYEPLPQTIRINGQEYNTLQILRCLEQVIGQKIMTKRNNRLLKNWFNVTIEFGIIPPERVGEPLIIIGKNELLEIW